MRFSRKGSKLVPTCSKLVPTGSKMKNVPKLTADVICAMNFLSWNEENESRNEKYMMYEI